MLYSAICMNGFHEIISSVDEETAELVAHGHVCNPFRKWATFTISDDNKEIYHATSTSTKDIVYAKAWAACRPVAPEHVPEYAITLS